MVNKYFISPLRQRFLSLRVTQSQVQEWMKNWKFFFILGLGRSGTNFLADVLNQAQGAHVFHEPAFEDFFAAVQAFYDPRAAERYMHEFRKKEIYLRMRHVAPGTYGEVNSGLRRHANAIKKDFEGASLIYLVRDGRDVVRSMMSRRTMTVKDPFTMSMRPTGLDPYRTRWNEMDRFSKLCWFWQSENSYLRTALGNPVQFEKILSSYDYFYDEILKPCHITVDRRAWESAVASPRNTTGKFKMSKWENWTVDQQKMFMEICGNEMAKCGYEF